MSRLRRSARGPPSIGLQRRDRDARRHRKARRLPAEADRLRRGDAAAARAERPDRGVHRRPRRRDRGAPKALGLFFPGAGGIEAFFVEVLMYSHPMDEREAAEWMRRQGAET